MTDIARTPDTREIPVAADGSVELELSSADLRIRGTAAGHVTVRTRDGRPVDGEVVIESEPGRVRIQDGEDVFRLGPVRFRTRSSAALDIDVPRTVSVVCRTLSGDITAEGIAGSSRWTTASGDIRVAVDAGPVAVDTMAGDAVVEASVPVGLTVRTVSGDVRARAPRLDAVNVATTSGDVRLVAALAAGVRHAITSVSGDVELETGSPVRVETHSVSGDVRADGPHRMEGSRGSRVVVVGDGSVVLRVSTTSGDVRLRALDRSPGGTRAVPDPPAPQPQPAVPGPAAAPAPPIAPAPPVAPAPPQVLAEAEAAPNLVRDAGTADLGGGPAIDRREAARLDVLRALERGELDVEAASRRLEILEDAGPRAFRGWC